MGRGNVVRLQVELLSNLVWAGDGWFLEKIVISESDAKPHETSVFHCNRQVLLPAIIYVAKYRLDAILWHACFL